jgi:carboxyl-terminal processing protease
LPTRADPDAWADLTADVIDLARSYSKAVETTPASGIYETVFSGVVAHLDRYSRYAGAEQAADNRAHRDGFGGIGVHIRVRPEGIEVVSVMEGTPAADAGLHRGDLITAVNGRPATDIPSDGGAEALRGPVDTDVHLTVKPADGQDTRQIAVHRTHIVPRTVTYEARGNAAYLRVSGFNQRTARTLRESITRAKADLGDRLAGYVLDLRDNPGGLLDQAVTVADIFLARGQVVSTHGRHPDSHQYFDAEAGDAAESAPLIVLINADSASASEIVAAALQDSGRALVLGSTSYGKGTVQTVLRLPNEGELTLTWARFMAPSGYALSKHGVVPNVCTSLRERDDIGALLRDLRRGALAPGVQTRPTAAAGYTKADLGRQEALAACPAAGARPATDVELARRLLQDPKLYKAAMAGRPARIAKADAAPVQP